MKKNALLILGILGIVLLLATFAFLFYMRVAGPYLNQARIARRLQEGTNDLLVFGKEAVPDYWPSVFGCEEITAMTSLPSGKAAFTDEEIALLDGLPALVNVDFVQTSLPTESMRRFLGSRDFKRLAFSETNLNDEMLRDVRPSAKLERMVLDRNAVSEAAVAELLVRCPGVSQLHLVTSEGFPYGRETLQAAGKLKDLRFLALEGITVTDEDLRFLDSLDRLHLLQLKKSPLRGPGIRQLSGLKNLRILNLSACDVTDEGLAEMGVWPQLALLDLQGTRITDTGLESLKTNFPAVTYLYLSNTAITDAGLKCLHELPLRFLYLDGTAISDEALEALKAAIPTLENLQAENRKT